jgi:hypothetical protein
MASEVRKRSKQPPKQAQRQRAAKQRILKYMARDGEGSIEDTDSEIKEIQPVEELGREQEPGLENILSHSSLPLVSFNHQNLVNERSRESATSERTNNEIDMPKDIPHEKRVNKDKCQPSENGLISSTTASTTAFQSLETSHLKITEADIASSKVDPGRKAGKWISAMPDHSTPHVSYISKSKRQMDKLEVLLEDEAAFMTTGAEHKEFNLRRLNPDDGSRDQDTSEPSASPSPSWGRAAVAPFCPSMQKLGSLLVLNGQIHTSDSRTKATSSLADNVSIGNGGTVSTALEKDLDPRLYRKANVGQDGMPKRLSDQVQLPEQRPQQAPNPNKAKELFRTKLRAKGVSFTQTEKETMQRTSLNEFCSTDSEEPPTFLSEKMPIPEAAKDRSLPAHQLNVRDALAEITEVLLQPS